MSSVAGPGRGGRLLAATAALQLAVATSAIATATVLTPAPGPGPVAVGARGSVAAASLTRAADVRALLAARATALRTHDRAGWLATVAPDDASFRRRQGRLFDALAALPLVTWSYNLDPSLTEGPDATLDARRGPAWWAPAVTLSYRLPGDEGAAADRQHLTFVPRRGRWLLAADDDFRAASVRGIWDFGPVEAVSGRRTLVLGHPGTGTSLRAMAATADAAVQQVTAIWGPGWPQRVVVLVPRTPAEFAALVGGSGNYTSIAAVATAGLTPAAGGSRAVGNRVIVSPLNFPRLGEFGRQVVMTHEVVHVATRNATGPACPAWLAEGFADYIGYRGRSVPYPVSAQELQQAVRRGDLPTTLPTDRDFDGGNPQLAQVYEQAWLAVALLAERYGEAGLVRFYRSVGGGRSVDAALTALFGTDTAHFTDAWRRNLLDRLT